MPEQTFTTPEHHDKSEWGDGPWQDEPDKIVWVDGATDLDCMIHRNRHGALCGYVGVTRGHPAYGLDYSSIFVNFDIDVHDDVTYAASCDENATPEHGLCHVPQDGRPDDVWWVGFSCAGAWDVRPAMDADLRSHGMEPLGPYADVTYKPVAYVRAEVRRLAEQLAELA